MSRIAAARKLADKLDTLAARLTGEQYTKYGEECPMALNLSWMIGQRYVLQVSEDALYILENAIRTVEEIAARTTGALNLEEAGPIYPLGTELMVCRNDYPDTPEHMVVTEAKWDGDFWQYRFTAMSAQGSIYVEEGDLRYTIAEFCPDEA